MVSGVMRDNRGFWFLLPVNGNRRVNGITKRISSTCEETDVEFIWTSLLCIRLNKSNVGRVKEVNTIVGPEVDVKLNIENQVPMLQVILSVIGVH